MLFSSRDRTKITSENYRSINLNMNISHYYINKYLKMILDKKWKIRCFESIANNLIKKRINEGQTIIWACQKLIVLVKLIQFEDAKEFAKDVIILVICELKRESVDYYNNTGIVVRGLSTRDKEQCLAILREEFSTKDLKQKIRGGNAI